MGRMDNNGFAPAMFMQGNHQNGCDNDCADTAAYSNGVCSDCETCATYSNRRSGKGCSDCDNNATYTSSRSVKGCNDCDNDATYTPGRSSKGCGDWDNDAAHTNRRSGKGCSCDNDGATHVYFETCENSKEVAVIGNCETETLGRVLDVGVTLRNVCPGRCSSLGVNLSEMDDDGTEYARGFRAISVPAHNARTNQDLQLDAVRFVLPEDRSLQRRRHLIVRTTHHYLDDGSI